MEQNYILFKFTVFYLISQNVHCHSTRCIVTLTILCVNLLAIFCNQLKINQYSANIRLKNPLNSET